jgi:Family of unknown function (DUF5759)
MANIVFADEEEATGKINIDDLYERNMQRDLKQLSLFNKILGRVHKRIQTNTKFKRNEKFIWFLVPEFIFGEPAYNQGECIGYLVSKLVENGFYVRYVHPNSLFVSWEQWIPSYVRTEIKKKTGKVINEKGQIINTTDGDDNGASGGSGESNLDSAIMNDGTAGNNNTSNKKVYTPITQYKPSGMVYNPDILDKLEKRFR